MNCNCIPDTEARLKEELEKDASLFRPKKATAIKYIFPKNAALKIKTGKTSILIPFEITWAMESGKNKETYVPIEASFCPFCGEPAETAEPSV